LFIFQRTRSEEPKGTPWYRKFNDTWYMPRISGKANPIVDADGLPVKGKDNREKAMAVWHQVVVRQQAPARGLDNPLKLVFDEFLDSTHRHREKRTYEEYRRVLQGFKDKWPG
jgi:hypothetical protein